MTRAEPHWVPEDDGSRILLAISGTFLVITAGSGFHGTGKLQARESS